MSAPDANGWMPIETAPKDGRTVLLYREPVSFGTSSPLIYGIWDPEDEEWAWPDDIFDPYDNDAMWDALNNGDNFSSNEFTHWRALLEPPVQHD